MDSLPRFTKRQRLQMAAPEICRRYIDGENTYALGTEFGCSDVTIGNILRRNGIKARSQSEAQRIYVHNPRFFDQIDSEVRAYWLGFLAADGCVAQSKWTPVVIVTLAEKDRSHLEAFRNAIGSNQPVRSYSGSNSFGGAKVRLGVTSSGLAAALESHGFTQHKTACNSWPNLPVDLYRHYLRGYFDGDGSFYAGGAIYKNGKRFQPTASMAGTEAFLAAAQTWICEQTGLTATKLYQPKHTKVIKTWNWTGTNKVRTFARLLYQDATIYLPRKRDKVAHLL